MKITQKQLKKIIQEELEAVMKEESLEEGPLGAALAGMLGGAGGATQAADQDTAANTQQADAPAAEGYSFDADTGTHSYSLKFEELSGMNMAKKKAGLGLGKHMEQQGISTLEGMALSVSQLPGGAGFMAHASVQLK